MKVAGCLLLKQQIGGHFIPSFGALPGFERFEAMVLLERAHAVLVLSVVFWRASGDIGRGRMMMGGKRLHIITIRLFLGLSVLSESVVAICAL